MSRSGYTDDGDMVVALDAMPVRELQADVFDDPVAGMDGAMTTVEEASAGSGSEPSARIDAWVGAVLLVLTVVAFLLHRRDTRRIRKYRGTP